MEDLRQRASSAQAVREPFRRTRENKDILVYIYNERFGLDSSGDDTKY